MENKKDKLNVISDWVYKPYQLIETIHFRKGEVSGINTFQIKAMNILFQALHNNIVKDITYKDKLGYSCYGLEVKEFLDKLDYDVSDIQNIKRDLKNLMDLKSETLGANGSFKLSTIIREIELNTNDGMIYFKVADIVDYIFKNNYVMLEDESMKHCLDDSGADKFGYARININSYPRYTKPKHAKALIFYEFLISKRYVIQNKNHIKIDIDRLKLLLNCASYSKNSDIINKMLIPTIKDVEALSGLKIYYKCSTALKYKKITSVSFKVYTTDTPLCRSLHKTSEFEEEKNKYYFITKEEDDMIFSFKSEEEKQEMIKSKLTNVEDGYIKKETEIKENVGFKKLDKTETVIKYSTENAPVENLIDENVELDDWGMIKYFGWEDEIESDDEELKVDEFFK